ncbi:hypothetical protein JNK13_08030 [bacterium]|nr:hypothetical protein [bacterium]
MNEHKEDLESATYKVLHQPKEFICLLAYLPALLVLFIYAGFCSPVDPDLGYHLTVGEQVLSRFAVPTIDSFRFDSQDPELAYSWLPAVYLYFAHSFGGAWGLKVWLLIHVSFLAILLSYTVYDRIRPFNAAVLLLLASIALLQVVTPRPRLLALIVFGLFLGYVKIRDINHERSQQRFGDRQTIAAVFLLSLVWANTHISCVLAPLILLLDSVIALSINPRRSSLGYECLRLLACILGLLFNPYGARIFQAATLYTPESQSMVAPYVLELRGFFDVLQPYPLWFWATLAFVVVAILQLVITLRIAFERRSLLQHLLVGFGLVIFTGYLTLQSSRNLSFFILSTIWMLATIKVPQPKWARSASWLGIALAGVAFVVGIQASQARGRYDQVEGYFAKAPISEGLEVVRPLISQGKVGTKVWRIFTAPDKGHFVNWWLTHYRLQKRAKVFVDGRTDALGVKRFFTAEEALWGPCFEKTLDDIQADIAIVNLKHPLFEQLLQNKNWVPLGGATEVTFVRAQL